MFPRSLTAKTKLVIWNHVLGWSRTPSAGAQLREKYRFVSYEKTVQCVFLFLIIGSRSKAFYHLFSRDHRLESSESVNVVLFSHLTESEMQGGDRDVQQPSAQVELGSNLKFSLQQSSVYSPPTPKNSLLGSGGACALGWTMQKRCHPGQLCHSQTPGRELHP